MIQKLLTSLAAIFFVLGSYAQGLNTMVINDTSGKSTQIMLQSELRVFVTDDHKLTADLFHGESLSYETLFEADVADIESLAFYRDDSGVTPLEATDIKLQPDFKASRLFVTGDTEVFITDISGLVLDRIVVCGQAEIDMTRYGQGIRMATSEKSTFKFPVR